MATNARLEELKKKFDENPRRYFAPLANEYRKQGDLTQAITLCRAHLPNQPGHISGHIVLAQALYEARELPESRQIFEQALELDPENLIALRFLGDIARAQDDLAAARGWYERVLDADPRNDEIVGLLRELAATPAPTPAAATEEFAPQQVQLVEPTAQPDAPEPVSWDPDKTPIANIAIPEPVVSASPAPVAPASAEEPTDIFGEGTVDQGAELIDSIEPHAGSRSVFLPTPTQPVSGFELPVAADAAPELLDLSLSEIVVDQAPPSEAPAAAEPELLEPPAAEPVVAELVSAEPDLVDAGTDVVQAESPSADVEDSSFVEDINAFAVAQELSDPEALPEPLTDEWFNAPTPPRGSVVLHADEIAQATQDARHETIRVPTPAAGAEAQSTSVEIGAFDLVDATESVTTEEQPATSAEAEHPASWFDEPTSVAPAAEPESDALAPALESVEVATDSGENIDAVASLEEAEPVAVNAAESVSEIEPPQVELEGEPGPDLIDRGITRSEDVFGSVELADEPTVEASVPPDLVQATAAEDPAMGRMVDDAESAPAETPPMFVTETMAELYLQQGFTEEALGIYRQLLEQNPSDDSLRARVAALQSGEPSSVEAASSAAHAIDRHGQSVRTFFGRVAAQRPRRRAHASALDVASLGAQFASRQTTVESEQPASTLSQMFAQSQTAPSDDAAATQLAAAFTSDAVGRPTRAADSELSLDHLFRDVPQEPSSAVTLDAFFAAPGGDSDSSGGGQDGPEERTGDIEQFTAWLEGLKKK